MGLVYNAKEEYARVKQKNDREYNEYLEEAKILNNEYITFRDKYNGEIAIINSSRAGMRDEIYQLYKFLNAIGGSLGEKITVFDFNSEAPAIYDDTPFVQKVGEPVLEEKHALIDPLVKTISIGKNNKKKIINFEVDVDGKNNEYTKDLADRKNKKSFVEDALKIAEIYRNIVMIVRDAIKNKILPEMGLIQAFLYADAIRERILDDVNTSNVHPYSIEEYRNTTQDVHYQFVRNAFDFYNISTNFFKRTILTDIIADKIVTEDEKIEFNKQIEEIKNSVRSIEEKKVL